MTTKPPLQKILQGILHTENESKQNHEEDKQYQTTGEDKESEGNVDSAAHNQTLKQQKQMTRITTYL
jgi:hypothetical protein